MTTTTKRGLPMRTVVALKHIKIFLFLSVMHLPVDVFVMSNTCGQVKIGLKSDDFKVSLATRLDANENFWQACRYICK